MGPCHAGDYEMEKGLMACSGSMENFQCGCTCTSPVFLTIDAEIRMPENHKKIMQEQIEVLGRKVADPLPVK
jgi:hypothetical protein